jgi:WD40 repeat protein
MARKFFWCVCMAAFLVAVSSLSGREWTDVTGSFHLEAKLLTVKEGKVYLEKSDGKVVPVPLDRLSEPDRKYLASLAKYRDYFREHPLPGISDDSSGFATIDVEDESKVGEIRNFPDLGWGVKSLAFSPNGGFLAVGKMDRALIMFDVNQSKRVSFHEKLEGLDQVTALAFTADGKKLLSGGYRGRIQVWDVAADGSLTESTRFVGHSKEVTCITISSDGKSVLSGSTEKRARFWSLETGREQYAFDGFKGAVRATFISKRGSQGLACDGETLALLDLKTGKSIQSMKLAGYATRAVAIAPDGSRVAVGETYDIRMWDIRSGNEYPKLEGGETQWAARFSPNSKYLITGGRQKVNLWEVETSRKLYEFDTFRSYAQVLAYSPDGRHIAAIGAGAGQTLQVFRLPASTAGPQ